MTDPLARVYDDPAQGPVTVASVILNSTATATVASGGFPGVATGDVVTGTGIAAGTKVVSVSGNTLLLSQNATSSTTSTLTFQPGALTTPADVSDTGTSGGIGDYLPSQQTTAQQYTYPEPLGHEPYPHYVQNRTYRTDGIPGSDGFNYQASQVFVTY